MATFPDPLRILDLAQTRAASVLALINNDQLDLPTPCDEWSVRDVINKLVASTLLFASFGRREDHSDTRFASILSDLETKMNGF